MKKMVKALVLMMVLVVSLEATASVSSVFQDIRICMGYFKDDFEKCLQYPVNVQDDCIKGALLTLGACLEAAISELSCPIHGATILSLTCTRTTGAPYLGQYNFTIDKEGDYFVNLWNGGENDTKTRVSSAEIRLNPGISVFRPNDFNKNVYFLVKKVHLQPGNYTLNVLLRSEPNTMVTIIVSDKDWTPVVL